MTTPGDIYIKLKRPCPRCSGVLERYEVKAVAGAVNPLPRVHCTACHVEWPSIREMILEAHKGREPEAGGKRGPSLGDLKGYLAKIKAGVRAGRNVAASVKTVSEYLASMVSQVRSIEQAPDKQQVIAKVGEDLEGIVDQVTLAVEHIEEGRTGKVGPEPKTEEEPEPEHAEDA